MCTSIYILYIYLLTYNSLRYSAHPTFKFSILNIKHKQQTMAATKFRVEQMPGEEAMSVADLEAIKKDSINYCNRVCLHGCSSYCLKRKMEGRDPITYCRFGFGEMNPDLVSFPCTIYTILYIHSYLTFIASIGYSY